MPQDARARLQELRADAEARVTAVADALDALTQDRSGLNDDDEHDPEGVPLSAEWSRLQWLAEAARLEVRPFAELCVPCAEKQR